MAQTENSHKFIIYILKIFAIMNLFVNKKLPPGYLTKSTPGGKIKSLN